MIVIAEVYSRFSPTLEVGELSSSGRRLLEFAESSSREYYADRFERLGISISVGLHLGSTKAWVTVGAVVSILTQYGNIRQSVDYLVKDSRLLAQHVLPGISQTLGFGESHPEYVAKRLGIPGRLNRIFEKVRHGELSPAEATRLVLALLKRADGGIPKELPEIEKQLSENFETVAGQPPVGFELPVPNRGMPDTDKTPLRDRYPVIVGPFESTRRKRRMGVLVNRDPKTREIQVRHYR